MIYESVRKIGENAAHLTGGSFVNEDYFDFMNGRQKKEDSRTAEEIVADITARAEIEVRHNGFT